MKVNILESFYEDLNDQVNYIASDKPKAARIFKKDILSLIKDFKKMPFSCRKSIYFDDDTIREAIFKGYKIIYRIKLEEQIIEVFGFINYQEDLNS